MEHAAGDQQRPARERVGAVTALVALGSNMGEPRQQVVRALDALTQLPHTRLLSHSRLYLTAPWGMTAQPPFVNAVAQLQTALAPHALMDALRECERRAGRQRSGERWGPRTLDLDLLAYGQVQMDLPDLTLPHPRMHERAFVLLPLSELMPAFILVNGVTVAAQLPHVDCTGCQLLDA